MKTLLYKELRLVMHPTILLFLFLSAMLLIPNYPYYVIFFYTMLGIFFACLTGRENHDLEFTLALPIRKRDVVAARFAFAMLVEGAQILIAVPCAILRQSMPLPGNEAGMDANIAFFGFSFLLLGIFHLIFFTRYYKAPHKVGVVFAYSSVVVALAIIVLEVCAHAVPFFRERLDTPDPQFLTEKLIVLGAGLLAYGLLTFIAFRKSARSFEALDL